jgi:hypothetical protein
MTALAVPDFGSQYAPLIAKELRRQGFNTEIHTPARPDIKTCPCPGDWFSPEEQASGYKEKNPGIQPQEAGTQAFQILGRC